MQKLPGKAILLKIMSILCLFLALQAVWYHPHRLNLLNVVIAASEDEANNWEGKLPSEQEIEKAAIHFLEVHDGEEFVTPGLVLQSMVRVTTYTINDAVKCHSRALEAASPELANNSFLAVTAHATTTHTVYDLQTGTDQTTVTKENGNGYVKLYYMADGSFSFTYSNEFGQGNDFDAITEAEFESGYDDGWLGEAGADEIPFVVVAGGVAVVAAAALAIAAGAAARRKNKQKNQNDRERAAGYILQLSSPIIQVGQNQPGSLQITAYQVKESGAYSKAPSVKITVAAEPDSVLSISPQTGSGQINLSIAMNAAKKTQSETINIIGISPKGTITAQATIELTDEAYAIEMATNPAERTLLTDGKAEIWVYARPIANSSSQTDRGKLQQLLQELAFSAEENGADWLDGGEAEYYQDWKCILLKAANPNPGAVGGQTPDTAAIVASLTVDGKKISAKVLIELIGEPELTVNPASYQFLSGSGETKEFTLAIVHPTITVWQLATPQADGMAARITKWNALPKELHSNQTAVFQVTECDQVQNDDGTNFSDQGKFTFQANSAAYEVSNSCQITVCREGLFRTEDVIGIDRETGAIQLPADDMADGSMQKAIFDLRFLRWNEQERRLLCETELFTKKNLFKFSAPWAHDEGAEAILTNFKPIFSWRQVRPSSLPSGEFSVEMDKIIPGKQGQRFRFSVTAVASIEDSNRHFELNIPFDLIPACLAENDNEWQKEYEYCKKIIEKFLPSDVSIRAMADLENRKYSLGVGDLKQLRQETWDAAQKIILVQRDSYLNAAAWYDYFLIGAQSIQWLNDRAFKIVASQLLGPVGAIVANQSKELIQDILDQCINAKDSDSWLTITWNLLYKRMAGSLGDSINSGYFSNREVGIAWVVSFFLYRWVFHVVFDYNDSGTSRKGWLAGLSAAAKDLTGKGFEGCFKAYVGKWAEQEGYQKNVWFDQQYKKLAETVASYLVDLQINITF